MGFAFRFKPRRFVKSVSFSALKPGWPDAKKVVVKPGAGEFGKDIHDD